MDLVPRCKNMGVAVEKVASGSVRTASGQRVNTMCMKPEPVVVFGSAAVPRLSSPELYLSL